MAGKGEAQVYTPRRLTAVLAALCVLLLVGLKAGLWFARGRAAAFHDARTDAAFAVVILILAFVGVRSWSSARRFGTSRFVPGQPEVRLGQTVTGTLEATERLAFAREVRFELVEMHRRGSYGGPYEEHVRATSTVPMGAFQVVGGRTRIAVALAVPVYGEVSTLKGLLILTMISLFIVDLHETEHVWEVRAAAEVEGVPYTASFRVTVVSATGEPPYARRRFPVPPSDKRPRSA